jgi:hypothetical protein
MIVIDTYGNARVVSNKAEAMKAAVEAREGRK